MNKVWLTFCCTNLDDIPVGVYATEAEARAAITPGVRPKRNPLGSYDANAVNWKTLWYHDGKWGRPTMYDFETGKSKRRAKAK